MSKSGIGRVVLFVVASFAVVNAEITNVHVTPIDNSAVLDGYVTQDILFTTDVPIKGNSLFIRVPDGRFYDHPLGSDFGSPSRRLIETDPSAEFDTFFDGPTDGQLVTLGQQSIDDTQVVCLWASLVSKQTGPMRMARLTLSEDTNDLLGIASLFSGAPEDKRSLKQGSLKQVKQGHPTIYTTQHAYAIEKPIRNSGSELEKTQGKRLNAMP